MCSTTGSHRNHLADLQPLSQGVRSKNQNSLKWLKTRNKQLYFGYGLKHMCNNDLLLLTHLTFRYDLWGATQENPLLKNLPKFKSLQLSLPLTDICTRILILGPDPIMTTNLISMVELIFIKIFCQTKDDQVTFSNHAMH